jgi:hypothetical protein
VLAGLDFTSARGNVRNALKMCQRVCKPGSVHRGLTRGWAIIPLGGRLPARSSSQPGRSGHNQTLARAFADAVPSLFDLAPGGVCHAAPVASRAVRSYRTFSPFAWPRPPRHILCGTFPEPRPEGCGPPDVIRHRGCVEPGLSSPLLAQGGDRPTLWPVSYRPILAARPVVSFILRDTASRPSGRTGEVGAHLRPVRAEEPWRRSRDGVSKHERVGTPQSPSG